MVSMKELKRGNPFRGARGSVSRYFSSRRRSREKKESERLSDGDKNVQKKIAQEKGRKVAARAGKPAPDAQAVVA